MKLQQLIYFVGVAEEGQFTRAASKLHVAQPALSHAIAHLESQLGVELLVRHARGVSLTAAGERFYAKARVAIEAVEEAELSARCFEREERSVVKLGFVGSPPMLDAPELFCAIAEAEPAIELTFRELCAPVGRTAAWLGEVDVALCFSPALEADVRTQPLRAEPRVLIAASTHPLASPEPVPVATALRHTFVGCDASLNPAWAGLWRLADHGCTREAAVTEDRARGLSEMVAIAATGRAVTAVPASQASMIARALPAVAAVSLADAAPVTLALVWRADTPNGHVARVVAAARGLAEAAGAERL